MFVTTTNDIDGCRIVRYLGVVRGISVRSRSVSGSFRAIGQALRGGDIDVFAEMADKARQDAFDRMVDQASALGANAILAMRYDANELDSGITEVLAYGTAVVVESA